MYFGIFLQGPQGECDASPKSKLKKHKVAEHEKKNGFEPMQFLCLKGSFEFLSEETQSGRTCEEKRIRVDAVFVVNRHF